MLQPTSHADDEENRINNLNKTISSDNMLLFMVCKDFTLLQSYKYLLSYNTPLYSESIRFWDTQ